MSAALDPIDVALGAEIRRLRNAGGVSMETLGERIGLSYQQVQKYERGVNRIAAATLVRIAEALGARPATILDAAVGPAAGRADVLDLTLALRFARLPEHSRTGLLHILEQVEAVTQPQKDRAA